MIGFKEWLNENDGVNPITHKALIELYLRIENLLNEAGNEPIRLPKSDMNFPLHYAGKHLEPYLPGTEKGKQRTILGPDDNYLIPIHAIPDALRQSKGDTPKLLSHFMRDQPYIAAFCQSSPENMAACLIFVLLTIRSDFMQVMQDFPVIMMILMSKFHSREVGEKELKGVIGDKESALAASSHPEIRKKTTSGSHQYRLGYSTNTTLFGTKYKGVVQIWNGRETTYQTLMGLIEKKDTVGCFEYLLQNISGIAQAKAGFAVQLLFGELGCIDMHNVNLYSQYYLEKEGRGDDFKPDHTRRKMDNPPGVKGQEMYRMLNPNLFSKKPKPLYSLPKGASSHENKLHKLRNKRFSQAVANYINVINKLEKDGFSTIKLWDIWVSYVSKIYVKTTGQKSGEEDAGSRYDRSGIMATTTLDPNDPTNAKILGIKGDIPDRNAIVTGKKSIAWEKDPKTGLLVPGRHGSRFTPVGSYSIKDIDKEKSAGSASLAHGAIWWWRHPAYMWDLVKQSEGSEAAHGFRYASTEFRGHVPTSSIVSKPLAYIVNDKELLQNAFPDPAERTQFIKRATDALNRHKFFSR